MSVNSANPQQRIVQAPAVQLAASEGLIRGIATGVYPYINVFNVNKSGQDNFLRSNDDVRTVIKCRPTPQ